MPDTSYSTGGDFSGMYRLNDGGLWSKPLPDDYGAALRRRGLGRRPGLYMRGNCDAFARWR